MLLSYITTIRCNGSIIHQERTEAENPDRAEIMAIAAWMTKYPKAPVNETTRFHTEETLPVEEYEYADNKSRAAR
jgi:hypothetical protein